MLQRQLCHRDPGTLAGTMPNKALPVGSRPSESLSKARGPWPGILCGRLRLAQAPEETRNTGPTGPVVTAATRSCEGHARAGPARSPAPGGHCGNSGFESESVARTDFKLPPFPRTRWRARQDDLDQGSPAPPSVTMTVTA